MLNVICLGISVLMLSACEQSDEVTANENPQTALTESEMGLIAPQKVIKTELVTEPPSSADITELEVLPASTFKTLEWTDLMPKGDLDALLNPPSYVTDVEDGSFEDQISNQIQSSIANAKDDRYQQALASVDIIAEMDGKGIRIAGFIVPLEFDDEQTITQFFLVPFFGACIHVPPPPPNQIIFVNYPKGIKLETLYDPFWISGILKTSLVENETATSAYSMQMQSFEAYTE
jgi:hypothetical protein